MKKINFVFKNASKQTRIMGIVALGLAALAILMLIVGTCSAIYGPLADVPVVELLGEAVPELDLDNLDDYVDEIKDAIEEEDDDLLDEIEDELGMSADEFLDYLDPLSLNSMKVMTDKMADFFDADNTFGIVISAVIGFISGYAILLGLFVALSALFMNKGWFIASAVISPLFFFAFVGFRV